VLPLQHMAIVEAADGRGVFMVPRGEYVYLGTTDTFHARAEHWPAIGDDDIDYVLDAVHRNTTRAPASKKAWAVAAPRTPAPPVMMAPMSCSRLSVMNKIL
jgi:glycerol-3-phosphate dehydrogenase